MNRRSLLAALPATLAASTAPMASERETLIEDLFPRWEAAAAAYSTWGEGDDDHDRRLDDAIAAIEDEILAITPTTAREYAFKILVLNAFTGIEGVPWGDAAMAEARALAGVTA